MAHMNGTVRIRPCHTYENLRQLLVTKQGMVEIGFKCSPLTHLIYHSAQNLAIL
jgi:hypothetical protein